MPDLGGFDRAVTVDLLQGPRHSEAKFVVAAKPNVPSGWVPDGVGLPYGPDDDHDEQSADFNVTDKKWDQPGGLGTPSNISFSFSNLFNGQMSGVTSSEARAAVIEGLSLWSAVAPLNFNNVVDSGPAVSDADYPRGTTPDLRFGNHTFDGPSGTLAHGAFPPPNGQNGYAGDTHFDNGETWRVNPGVGGIDLIEVATHEIGHNLGLDHQNSFTSAIMNPFYAGRYDGPDTGFLRNDDINGIRAIYGTGFGYVLDSGTLYLSGTDSADTITIDATATDLILSRNGSSVTRSLSGVTNIRVLGRGGNDVIRIERNAGRNVTVDAGAGDDFIDLGFGNRNLNNVSSGNLVLIGGDGADSTFVYDNANTAGQTFAVDSIRFDRPGWAGFAYSADIEGFVLTTGLSGDTVNITETFAGQPVFLRSAGGAGEVVNVGSATSGLQHVDAAVDVGNDPSLTTLNLNNGPDAMSRAWTVDVAGQIGSLVGIAPAAITWDNVDIAAINLLCGSGRDTGQITRLTETLNIGNSGVAMGTGRDQISVGSAAADGMQGITGQLRIDNNPALTDLILSDSGNVAPRTATLDVVTSYNRLTGLAPGVILFDDGDVDLVTIRTGNGSDTLNVLRAGGTGLLTLTSAGGSEFVNLGNPIEGMQQIDVDVVVRNTPAFTTLTLDNAADTAVRSVTVGYNESTKLQTLDGLAPERISFAPSDLNTAKGVTIVDGVGATAYAVGANRVRLDIDGNGPGDHVTVGSVAEGLAGIVADVVVRNTPQFTTLTIDDAAAAAGRTFSVDVTTVGTSPHVRVALSPSANVLYRTSDVTVPVSIRGGSGDDTFLVSATAGPTLALSGNAGDDRFELGGPAARTLDPINAAVAIDGGLGGGDVLLLDDRNASTAGNISTLNTTSVATSNAAAINFGAIESVAINLANNGAKLVVTDTLASVDVTVLSGASADAIWVDSTGPGRRVVVAAATDGSTGYDDVRADYLDASPDAAEVALAGGYLGDLTARDVGAIRLAGPITVRTSLLSLPNGGLLDLADGAMVYDRTAADTGLAEAVRLLVQLGRNGGNWQGTSGITSAAAAADGTGAVGFAEASDVRTSFPATFQGVNTIDNTTVLLRHTRLGDATLDGTVNFADLFVLAQNYNESGRRWSQGDFNFDANVNFADLLALAQNYNQSVLLPSSSRAGPTLAGRGDAARKSPVSSPSRDVLTMI